MANELWSLGFICNMKMISTIFQAWHADASGTLANASPRRPSTNNSRNNSRPSSTIDVGAVDVNTYEDPDALTSSTKFPAPPPLSETVDHADGGKTAEVHQGFVDDFEDETEPVGTCVALYDFDGKIDKVSVSQSSEITGCLTSVPYRWIKFLD